MIKFRLKKGAQAPKRANIHAAGHDLHCIKGAKIPAGKSMIFETGVSFEIPAGHFGAIKGRSGLAFKSGLFAFEGTIDEDYRGEVGIMLYNTSGKDVEIKDGERIAQIVFQSYIAGIVPVAELPETERGESGFGSTGKD
jgi:dUTP pyrophosphatase